MDNFLIVCDRIPPEHSASGRFIYTIADEMAKKYSGHIICLTSENKSLDTGLCLHRIIDRYGRYQRLLKKAIKKTGLLKLIYKAYYHIYYKWASHTGLSEVRNHARYYIKEIRRIIKKYGVCSVISVSNPFDVQIITAAAIRPFDNVKWYPYLMDSNRNNAVRRGTRESELELFSRAEKIFIVPALLQDGSFCEDFKEKIVISDLPIVPAKVTAGAGNGGKTVFIYAGLFYKDIRNPETLFKIFEKLPENFELHLYYSGCSGVVEKYKKSLGSRLVANGFVSPDDLEKLVSNADFVVNVGNTVLNQVASKVYDLIAFGKPILNFYQNENDISLEHMSKYPLCKSIRYANDEGSIDEILEFCKENKGKFLSYDEAIVNLKEKSLENVAGKIIKQINL
jgi:hypothetical protein